MKRILFLETGTPTITGGAGGSVNSLFEIIKGIHNENFEISILFYNEFSEVKRFIDLGCKVLVKNSDKSKINNTQNKKRKVANQSDFLRPIKFQLSWIKLIPKVKYIYKILVENQIDIIHCNDRISTNFEGIMAGILANKKIIVHQRQFENKLPFIMKTLGKRVDKYFAISNSIAENLLHRIKLNKNKTDVLFNWISDVNEKDSPILTEGQNILWIGRIVPWKGIHILLEIVKELIYRKINFNKIVIYGESDPSSEKYMKSFLKKIEDNNLSAFFEFRGYKPIAKIDSTEFKAFIHTSINPEPFGRTLIECMNKGIPVFATDLGGVKDIIKDSYNGFLYSPNNIDELWSKINSIEQKELRLSIINNAFTTIKEKFSGKKQIESIIKTYQNL